MFSSGSESPSGSSGLVDAVAASGGCGGEVWGGRFPYPSAARPPTVSTPSATTTAFHVALESVTPAANSATVGGTVLRWRV